jgi:hypothetical protein
MRLAFVLAVLLPLHALAQPLGANTPPPGALNWPKVHGRAQWVADSVKALAPNANVACVYAVALEILGAMEVEWSLDVKGRGPGTRRTVAPNSEFAYSDALKKNAEQQCNDKGGGGGLRETVRGLLFFTSSREDWMTERYERLTGGVTQAAQGLLSLGVLVPEGGAALPVLPTISLPILSPELFMAREPDPAEGT